MPAKTLSTAAVKAILQKKGHFTLPSKGLSMFPLIKEGEQCSFSLVDPDELKDGDIVLFEGEKGQLISHRLTQSFKVGNERIFMFQGDTNEKTDHPVKLEQLIGKLESIEKKRGIFKADGKLLRCWSFLIIRFPSIRKVLHHYVWKKNRLKQGGESLPS